MSRIIKVLKDGEWTEVNKSELVQGQLYRSYDDIVFFETNYTPEVKPNKIVITSHSGRALVMQGSELTVDIEMQDGEGNLLNVTDNFAIPVGKVGAGNYTTLLVEFVKGKASRSYTWNDAGEFEITESMINMHLDESNHFDFDGFNITVAG